MGVNPFWQTASGPLAEATYDFIEICDYSRNFLIGYKGNGGGARSFIPGFSSAPKADKIDDEGVDVGQEIYDDSPVEE